MKTKTPPAWGIIEWVAERDRLSEQLTKETKRNARLRTALIRLADECQASRKYIVVSDDNGFHAYNMTASALVLAREVLAENLS